MVREEFQNIILAYFAKLSSCVQFAKRPIIGQGHFM